MRRLFPVSIICLLASRALVAAEFWETKPFREWSDKEARKMLEDSPWAAVTAVPLPNRAPVPTADPAGGGRGGGGRGGGEGFGPAPVRVRLTISWRSALPLKQATARQQAGTGGTVPPEVEAALAREEELYVVAVQGLPPQYSQSGHTIDAFLHRDGKPDIPAARGASQPSRGGALLLVGFPRTDPITLADGDVVFEVKIGALDVKKKFKLKDMVFHGRLEL